MMVLMKCTGKFCYRHGKFQKTEAAAGGVLKIQINVSQNSPGNIYARVLFLMNNFIKTGDSNTGVFLWTLLNF